VRPTARGGARAALAGCALALAVAGACNEEPQRFVDLVIRARWNDDPASADQIGYEVEAQIMMLARAQSCYPLPDLRITVNDTEYPSAPGDCDTQVQVTAPARTDADTVVSVRSAHGPMGTGTFRGLFPGSGASQLVSPADGRVRMGETFTMSIPAGWPVGDGRVSAHVQWLDPAPSVPPFYSYVIGNANAERTAVELIAPALTGRAQVVLNNLGSSNSVAGEACTGFTRCFAFPSADVLGPVAIEVVP